ncbi:MAG: RND transporter [Rubrivivax sp.]|nr:RND transporter [Rubrivivax sp.]
MPLPWLLAIAAWLAVAPLFPEPHLWEKLKMLAAGTLERPIDIFDLLMHATPVVLLAWRLARQASRPKH